MPEIVEEYAHPLPDLITPYATESSTRRLLYKMDRRYGDTLPERVVADLVRTTHNVTEQGVDMETPVAEKVIHRFVDQCYQGEATKVVSSIIKWNTGAYYKLEDTQIDFQLPFNMDEDFQRKLLVSAATADHEYMESKLNQQLKENPDWDGIPKYKEEIKSISEFIPKINERKPSGAQVGMVK